MKKLFSLFAVILFLISGTLISQVDVSSTGGVPNASYGTLKGAFDAINLGTHTGIITIGISANTTETVSAVLNASGSGSANYSGITINPTGGASRTITGNLALPLIRLNGADNVTIDGLNSGGNTLTISNTNTSATLGTSTLLFIGDAVSNTVTNCNIQGSATIPLGTDGGVVFFSTGTTTGNDNNTVSFCNIGPSGANLPTKCVYGNGSTGTAAVRNSGNTIINNNIFDFFSATQSVSGIYILSGCDLWTISNNRIYQTAPRTFTAVGLRYAGITVNSTAGTTGSFTISGNIIGFGSSSSTGTTTFSGSTNTFRGIEIPSVSTVTPTSIQGNTISGINQTTATTGTGTATNFVGMMLGTTTGRFDVGNITGNSIGSLDGSSTIVINVSAGAGTVNAIYDFSLSSNNISNNSIGSITIQGSATTVGFRGILVNTATASTTTINNNTIANITDNLVGSYAMYCIQSILPSATITGNTIRNITGNSNGAVVVMSGIIISTGSTGVNVVSQNTVHSLQNTVTGGAAGAIYGIDVALPVTSNIIERNFVHSCNVTTSFATYQLYGMVMRGQGSATFKNNMIRLGVKSDGSSITTGMSIIGIRDIALATTNYFNNSVYIGGAGVVSSSNTYCFYSDVVTNTRSFQNNLFWNARSNGTGTIANISIRVGGTAPNPAGLTCNYNLLAATGVSGTTGVFNGLIVNTIADWRTATGQDVKSFTTSPLLINPTGTSSTVNLHVEASDLTVSGRGTYIASVNNDFDGNTRTTSQSPSLKPVDVGADQYIPSSYSGNILAVTSPSTLSDGNLQAIELTGGSITFSEARQYTGVKTPNNAMLRLHTSTKKNIVKNTISLPNNTYLKTTVVQNPPVLRNEPVNPFNSEATENSLKQSRPVNQNDPVKQNNDNKINNEIPVKEMNKKGSAGGNTDASAVNTPWIYWEIDNLVPTDPVTLRFYYNDDQMATIVETDLKISFWNGTVWDNSFTQSVDVVNNFISVTLPTGAGWPSTSLFSLEDQGNPLPVVLSSFDAAVNRRDINLSWVTESEINNKGFAVERRLKTPEGTYASWKEISFVEGRGNSSSPVSYSFTDKKLNSGAYQYRLKQVDLNGNYEYHSPANNSDIVIGKPGSFDVSQNYPNPSNPRSKIDFQMPFDGKVSIKVYDILGRQVASLIDEFKQADFYTVEFDGSNVSSGTYFYRIIAEGDNQKFTKTLKMLLIK